MDKIIHFVTNKDVLLNAGAIAAMTAFFLAVIRYCFEFFNWKSRNKWKEEYLNSFNRIVPELSSESRTARLSAAIMLRHFLGKDVHRRDKQLSKAAVNVISSQLRVLPTGVLQKTLADGLAFARNLKKFDLQKTNLQDALLDDRNGRLVMKKTDLFLADLSYANLKGIKGKGIVLYEATLFSASVKNCNFKRADFRSTDLTGVSFKKCKFKNANFSGALNVPNEIKQGLDANGIFKKAGRLSATNKSNGKTVFFSMPGSMTKENELITKNYKELLVKNNYKVVYYTPDQYSSYGQFNQVLREIKKASAMIVFGFKQIHIKEADYREGTKDASKWDDRWLSTLWNEIEGGMGLMKGIPLLLVCDPDINNGIFDDDLSECFVLRISTDEDFRTIEQNSVYRNWLSKF